MKTRTDEQLANDLENLADYLLAYDDYEFEADAPTLAAGAARIRAATEPGAGIRAVYEKWKYLDDNGMLSDRGWHSLAPSGQMFYDFWAAIKAAVEGVQDEQ